MDSTLALITAYGYTILVPLAIVEGPIITVIAGFLASSGIFNPVIVYIIAISGDLIGDTIAYSIGRWGGRLLKGKLGKFLGATPEKLEAAKQRFASSHRKTIILSKVLHGIGITGLTAAGILKIPYFKYITTCVSISLVQSAILLSLGLFVGSAYVQIGKYMNYFAATTVLIGLTIAAFFLLKKLVFNKKYG